MKIRYIFNYVATIVTMFTAISCETTFSEEEMPQQFVPNGEVVMADKYRSLVFNGNADSEEITFYANDDWKILTTQSWVTFSENSGVAGTHTITINVDKSYEDGARESSLTFVVERLRESFIITQSRGNFMVPDKESYGLFTLSDGTFDVDVRYNTEFTIGYDFGEQSEWIRTINSISSVAAPSETTSTTLNFEYDENDTYNDREATVILANESMDCEETFTVSQAGKIPVVLAEYETILLTYAAITDTEPAQVALESAIDFEVTSSVDWITPARVSFESGTYTFNYTVLENEDKQATRIGYIYLTSLEHDVVRTITVTQDEYNDDAVISVSSAGELANKITELLDSSAVAAADYNRLYISGSGVALNSDDFSAITTNFTGVKLIDISATATTEIPASRFQAKTSLEQFIFPNTIEIIGDSAFQNTSLTSVIIPGDSGCVKIGYRAFFSNPKLESVILEEGVVELGVQAFSVVTSPPSETALATISIPSTITTWVIGSDDANKAAFGCTSLKNVTLAEGLKTLGIQAFASTGIESVKIPSSIDFSLSINSAGDNKAFGSCPSLDRVEFSEGLKSITNNPFTSCTMLSTVIMPESIPSGTTLGSSVGSFVTGGLMIYVPADSYDDYILSDWNTLYNISSLED